MGEVIVSAVSAETVYPLRQRILRPEKPFDFSIYPDDNRESTVHLGAFCDGELAGIASIYRESPADRSDAEAWRLRDMGVVERFRRQGYGTALLTACLSHVSLRRGSYFWCYARKPAIPFYLARGLRLDDRPFEMPGFGERFFMWCLVSHAYDVTHSAPCGKA